MAQCGSIIAVGYTGVHAKGQQLPKRGLWLKVLIKRQWSVVEGASGSVWIEYRCGLHRCTRKRAAIAEARLVIKSPQHSGVVWNIKVRWLSTTRVCLIWIYYRCGLHRCTRKKAAIAETRLVIKRPQDSGLVCLSRSGSQSIRECAYYRQLVLALRAEASTHGSWLFMEEVYYMPELYYCTMMGVLLISAAV